MARSSLELRSLATNQRYCTAVLAVTEEVSYTTGLPFRSVFVRSAVQLALGLPCVTRKAVPAPLSAGAEGPAPPAPVAASGLTGRQRRGRPSAAGGRGPARGGTEQAAEAGPAEAAPPRSSPGSA